MADKTINAANHDLRFVNSGLKEAIQKGEPVVVRRASHLHGLAAGLRSGEVTIVGNAGDYTGALNAGARVVVKGNSGRFTADNMTSGEVIVEGSAGYGSGIGMYGGTLLVRKDSGDYTGVINKNGTIVVLGDAGNYVGVYMVGGDIIILGKTGNNLGDWMIKGTIYVLGDVDGFGNNTKPMPLAENDREKLAAIFERYDLNEDPSSFRKIVPESLRPFYSK
jgi:glutamate synthase domain-containing protein 3